MCYSVWGFVYLYSGHAKCLLIDKRTAPHFLFTQTAARELLRQQTYFQTMKNEKYIAPEIEVVEIAVEQGFATSGSGGQEEIGGSKEEGEW